MKLNMHLAFLLITFFLTTACTRSYETLSDALPRGMLTQPCDFSKPAILDYIYTYEDKKALLFMQQDDKLLYLAEDLGKDQSAQEWYANFYRKLALEAGESGAAGMTFYIPLGTPINDSVEGATYFVQPHEAAGKKVELASLLCAQSRDQSQLVFVATLNVFTSKTELIKNAKVYDRAFGGTEKKQLEEKIIAEVSAQVRQEKKGVRVERAKK